MMKTVRFHETGGPDVLRFEEVDAPLPGPGQIQVRVEAVGVNFADVLRRRGSDYPDPSPTPFTLGGEVAGTVSAVGDGVQGFALGDAVYATTRTGGYAQFVVIEANIAVPLPPGIDAAEATGLVIQGLTALLTLRDAGRMRAGDTVFIEAAAGGVGALAVQLARLGGAGLVIGAASTPEKRDFVTSLGADMVVDYTRDGWADEIVARTGGRGVDIVLEMTGGKVLVEALGTLAPFGRMVIYGDASDQPAAVAPKMLTNGNHSITGFYIGGYFQHKPALLGAVNEIIGHVARGELKVHIGNRFPLSQAAEAHRVLEGRMSSGRVVLEPWSDA